jgi:hypothetical protein
VAHSGQLYSTAGVSNAVEGSLTVIQEMLGDELARAVAADIRYPHSTILTNHRSESIKFRNIITIAEKVAFKKNLKLGLLLQPGINEFEIASVLDTYARTFPKSFKSFTFSDSILQTKYGLNLLVTGGRTSKRLDELHTLQPVDKVTVSSRFPGAAVVLDTESGQYPIEACLERISGLFGLKFQQVVKLLLDYN